MNDVELLRLGSDDVGVIMSGAALFDDAPREEWAAQFLARDGHHMIWARVGGHDVVGPSDVTLRRRPTGGQ